MPKKCWISKREMTALGVKRVPGEVLDFAVGHDFIVEQPSGLRRNIYVYEADLHGAELLTCQDCRARFVSRDGLARHRVQVHDAQAPETAPGSSAPNPNLPWRRPCPGSLSPAQAERWQRWAAFVCAAEDAVPLARADFKEAEARWREARRALREYERQARETGEPWRVGRSDEWHRLSYEDEQALAAQRAAEAAWEKAKAEAHRAHVTEPFPTQPTTARVGMY